MRTLPIIGVTRFSVDPLSIIRESMAESEMTRRRAAIYSTERLLGKLALFEEFTLPSLGSASQIHDEFFHFVACSTELPAGIKAKLEAIQKRNGKWLRLLEVHPHESFTDALRTPTRNLADGRRFFNFRIDDDDAISPDFVTAILAADKRSPNGTVLSFDLGCYLQRISDDRFVVHDFDYPKIAIGLGVFSSADCAELVFDLPVHNKIPEQRVVNIRDQNYWLRTLHSHNDSGTRSQHATSLSLSDAYALLCPRFAHLHIHALSSLSVACETSRPEGAPKVLFHIQ